MIICGYAGIGKSWMAHNVKNVMDLESTPFEKDWVRYAKCAAHYHDNGHVVLVSCHQELRNALREICLYNSCHANEPGAGKLYTFATILPDVADKEIYCKIYEERGNTQQFIDMQMEHWEEWTTHKSIGFEFVRHLAPGGERLYDYMKRMNSHPYGRCSFCDYDGCQVNDPIKAGCGKAFEIEHGIETKWISYKEQKPAYGVEVLAYHHDWVDEDFNPNGIRVGFLQENLTKDNDPYDFVSAFWWNYQDCYMTISKVVCEADDNSKAFYQDHLDCIEPEYWMKIPKFIDK